jgi:hypothetical protein
MDWDEDDESSVEELVNDDFDPYQELGLIQRPAYAKAVNPLLERARKAEQEHLLASTFTFGLETGMCPDLEEQPHREMAAELDAMEPVYANREQESLLYLAPRHTFKTSLVEADITKHIIKHPNDAIGLFRASRELAAQMVNNISDAFKYNSKILDLWGDLSLGSDKWSEYELRVNNRTKARREPTLFSAGLKVTTTGLHFDRIYNDDLVTEQNCDSIKEMEQAKKLLQAQRPLMSPWATRVISGTIWSNIDAYVWALDKNKQAQEATPPRKPPYKTYIRRVYVTNPTTGEEDLFFPALITEKFLEQQRAELEPRWYAAWYLLQTHEIGLKPFEHIKYFSGDYYTYPAPHIVLTEPGYEGEKIFVYPAMQVDPALTASASSDSFGLVCEGFDANGNWLVLESREVRKLPDDAGFDVIEMLMTYEPRILIIESANADAGMLARIADAIRNTQIDCQIIGYSALQDEPRGRRGKDRRIGAMSPLNKQGKILLRRGFNSVLARQMDLYPSLTHDDVIDAFSMGRKAFAMMPPMTPLGLKTVDNGLEKPDTWKQKLVAKYLQQTVEPGMIKGDWSGVSSQTYAPSSTFLQKVAVGISSGMKLVSSKPWERH